MIMIMTFDEAQEAFENETSSLSAAVYLRVAKEYFEDGMIGEETFLHAIQDVITWLETATLAYHGNEIIKATS